MLNNLLSYSDGKYFRSYMVAALIVKRHVFYIFLSSEWSANKVLFPTPKRSQAINASY